MAREICALIFANKMYIIEKEDLNVCGQVCRHNNIGDIAIAFANADLSALNDFNAEKTSVECCFDNDEKIYGSVRYQNIIMGIIQRIESLDTEIWMFPAERNKLHEIEQKVARGCPSREELQNALYALLSGLESIAKFQNDLRSMLFRLSLADKKPSAYASNAQLASRLFDDFPELAASCCGQSGYMIVDVDEQGELRTEMLDYAMSNAFRAVLTPDAGPLERHDINNKKVIGVYHIVSDVRMLVMLDLIEGLRNSKHFSQCASCKKFFFSTDLRQVYCSNRQCGDGPARTKKSIEKAERDPFLKEARRCKNVMYSRYIRSCDESGPQKSRRFVSRGEYDAWVEKYSINRKIYEEAKAKAMLHENPDEIIRKSGEEFLNKIKPELYENKHGLF